jgi:formylglycine-generating enzyme required for sulfatase activity
MGGGARGREGRRYAWGPGFDPARCNAFETDVRATTPVGIFPGGDSPGGVADLAGNVWEWTGSIYVPYPYRADDGREDPEDAEARRVVRGGSWADDPVLARCAYRYDFTPGDRSSGLGLRLVCGSHRMNHWLLEL